MKWNKLHLLLLLLLDYVHVGICVGNNPVSRDDRDVKFASTEVDEGLFPHIFNLATKAHITANATCGDAGPEVYCRLVEHVPNPRINHPQCRVCDRKSVDEKERHPIENAIDGTNSWWQSPSIANGMQYHRVSVTLDLGQVFQVAYIILKAANSPRPGNWILERSVDGVTYRPWQYHSVSDTECLRVYGKRAAERMEEYSSDDEVICTSYYSNLEPLRDGEIHTSLINGRPSAASPSQIMTDFMSARYIRFRFQRIRTLYADLMSPMYNTDQNSTDPIVSRRYFYSIKDISVGGHCICHGHAQECIRRPAASRYQQVMWCVCQHNTCGESCNECCPGYHQMQWGQGLPCEACNCHNRADECYYDLAAEGRSLDAEFLYRGGGVCVGCRDNTQGINCEQCMDGYYQPEGMLPEYPKPCTECGCDPIGTIPDEGNSSSPTPCIKDDSLIDIGVLPGSCACNVGYAGLKCDQCARGYRGYPLCRPCPCSAAGSINEDPCEGPCICKPNVEGPLCDRCVPGTFNLNERDPLGCTMCFCFGVTTECTSSPQPIAQIISMNNWFMTRFDMRGYAYPQRISTYAILADHREMAESLASQEYYFLAPKEYIDNKLTAYGGVFKMTLSWRTNYDIPASDISRKVVIILEGYNMRLARQFFRDPLKREDTISFIMTEAGWFHLPEDSDPLGSTPGPPGVGTPVSQAEFMNALSVVRRLMIGALQDPPQISVLLKDVSMDVAVEGDDASAELLRTVEECSCPSTYEGLSCESCIDGYRRTGGIVYGGDCEFCDCNGHSSTCDDITGECLICEDNTYGSNCELCLPGYYGNASSTDGCVRCACPLLESSNNFSPSCLSDMDDGYICDQCYPGYVGDRCEWCADGYFGNPFIPGGQCQPCSVGCQLQGCHSVTGECLRCSNNATGPHCGRCADGYHGNPTSGRCQACDCDVDGSESAVCDHETGSCWCRSNVTGRSCDHCQDGSWNLTLGMGCQSCDCNTIGSLDASCDLITGQCHCKEGVTGLRCDKCQPGYWGFSTNGCQVCACETGQCDTATGECFCPPNTVPPACKDCLPDTWMSGDPLEGCVPCHCSVHGSHDTQCDVGTGQCRCRRSYTGLRCDHCPRGHWGFPECRRCKCRPQGTDLATCDGKRCDCSDDGQCVCKEGYSGLRCDRCAAGYFELTSRGIGGGCLGCFCSGVSSDCSQAEYVYTKLRLDSDSVAEVSAAVSFDGSGETQDGLEIASLDLRMNISHVSSLLGSSDVHWKLPPSFAGSKITSYGGSLRYKITLGDIVTSASLPSSVGPYLILVGPDLLLEGSVVMKERSDTELMFKIDLIEENFLINGSINGPSRSEFLSVLAQLKAIHIRANVVANIQTTVLSKVSMDVGVPGRPSDDNPQASAVEQCKCPPGYSGTSCERCSDGYVRVSGGPPLGTCQLCECNGHGTTCEDGTGACIDCRDNTVGLQCDRCAPGFYGDATGSTPTDCKQCTCPLAQPGNNFSPACELITDGSHNCTACQEGYTGRYCGRCQEGYFGDPSTLGGSCHPCVCNGLGSVSPTCNMITGLCHCREGVKGDKYNECPSGLVLEEGGCISCLADTCSSILLEELSAMQASFNVSFNASSFVIIPWSGFLSLRNRSQELSISLEDYLLDIYRTNRRMPATAGLLDRRKEDIRSLSKRANSLLPEMWAISNGSAETLQRGLDLQRNISRLMRGLNDSFDELRGLMQSQGQLPAETNEELLKRAIVVLNGMRERGFQDVIVAAGDEHELAVDLYNWALSTVLNNTHLHEALHNVTSSLSNFRDSVGELLDLTGVSENTTAAAVAVNNRTHPHHGTIQYRDDTITLMDESINGDLHTAWGLINTSWMNLDAANTSIQEFLVDHQGFTSQLESWENVSATLARSLPEFTTLVTGASLHSQGLWNLSTSLASLLKPTRHLAENALRAARAYADIISAIERAENASETAVFAAEDAYDKTFLRDGTTVLEGALILSAESEGHLLDALGLQDILTSVGEDLKRAAKKIKRVNKKLNSAEKDLRNMERALPAVENSDFSSRSSDVGDLAASISNKSWALTNQSLTYIDKFRQLQDDHELVQEARDETNNNTARAIAEVELARTVVNNFHVVSSSLEDMAAQYGETESQVRGDIAVLREKIRMAKNEASKIRLALRSEGNCSRVYRPTTSPSAYNTLTMMVAISRANNQLFSLGGNSSDFFSLETIDSQVIFRWDVGSGVGVVSSTVIMVHGKWYQIEATRIGQTGYLTVEDVKNPLDTPMDSRPAPLGSTILDVGDGSVIYIGGVPLDQKADAIQTRGFEGCMAEVVFDGEPIGLWNYEFSEGECHGCTMSPLTLKKEDGFGFDGSGYAMIRAPATFRPDFIYVAFNIRTLSQDALLLFLSSTDQADFVSLELRGGKIITKLDLGEGAGVGESAVGINNDTWHSVSLTVVANESSLYVDRVKVASVSTKPSPDGLTLFPLTEMFIGGLPFHFDMSRDVGTDSFRGCIRNFNLYRRAPDLLQPGQSFGVSENCAPRKVERSLGLDGTGRVALRPVPLGREANITVTFTTLQENAVILAAGDLDDRNKRDINYDAVEVSYAFLLADGLLQVHVNAGQGRLTLESRKSDGVLNDGRPHTVLMQKDGKRIRITIDDLYTRSGRLPGTNLFITARSPLYVGGVGSGVTVSRLVQSLPWFSGCIENLLIMGELLAFNDAAGYPSATIGFCGLLSIPPPRPTMAPLLIGPPAGELISAAGHSAQSCHVPSAPDYIPYGLRFGITPESYATVNIIPAEVSKVKPLGSWMNTNGTLLSLLGYCREDYEAGVYTIPTCSWDHH